MKTLTLIIIIALVAAAVILGWTLFYPPAPSPTFEAPVLETRDALEELTESTTITDIEKDLEALEQEAVLGDIEGELRQMEQEIQFEGL